MRAIRISAKRARALLDIVETHPGYGRVTNVLDAARELRAALDSAPVRAPRTPPRPKLPGRASFPRIRKLVSKRAGLLCECGCGRWFRALNGAAEVDHFFGRGREESVESCWRLRSDCHRAKTGNSPSAAHWLEKFITHCKRHGYAPEAERAQARLDALRLSRPQQEGRT
jgi:hypothetical protein